ncbi:hypothetical protein, partial [Salmonella enterica]|uniref:hypothetical protein n=2 Tax=Salmonella enterica TaxID=28901 RepID=UPI00344DD070
LFIFAKCAAPFRGKNRSLHNNGATDAVLWCNLVAPVGSVQPLDYIKQLACQNEILVAVRGCRPDKRSAIRHGAIQLPDGGVTPYPAYIG